MEWPSRGASSVRAIRGMHCNKEDYAMSKTEDVRKRSFGMDLGGDTPESGEAAMLQDRLALLNKQENLRAKTNAEVISLLENLQREIKNASDNVRASAHEVRGYPVEVVTQLSTRLEVCVARCEDAARRAAELFEKIIDANRRLEQKYLFFFFMGCTGVASLMGIFFVFVPKMFR
jgi:hypothetical protein